MQTPEEHADALPHGHQLHAYRIERVLGSGAFGITYLVRHRHLNTLHVIKEYLPDCGAREQNRSTVRPRSTGDRDLFDWGLKSFFKEAQLLHQLSHPHIVKVTDLFEANSTAYFVMPYLKGITLHEWMKVHPNPFQNELEAVFVPLLEGLKYIHDKGLLHRDIKPENIYILENGHPILIDFGSARIAIGQKSKALTQVLTPHFAPHEQYRTKGTFTPALDLYGIAACMYQAITGELPEEAPNRIEEDLQPKLVGGVYEGRYNSNFLRAIDKSLSVYAKDRHQDGFDLQKDLVDVEILNMGDRAKQLLYDDGCEYFGELKDAKRHGQGTWTHPDGRKYVGEWKNDKRYGHGTETLLGSASKYVGEWVDDKRHGQGAYTFVDGQKKYVGEFKDGKIHGQGTWTHLSGIKYVGEFKDDKRHGQGIWTHPDGRKYVGEWKDGKRNGQGIFYDAEGRVINCQWLDGKPVVEKEGGLTVGDHVKLGTIWTEPFTVMKFVWVPEGTFEMGDVFGDGEDNEKPVHTVELDGFWLGKYPVTQAQWEKVMGNNPSHFKGPNNPVESVSWDDAQEFIQKLNSQSSAYGFRLPTEAEWEYACRGGGRQEKCCGGSSLDSVAWYSGNNGGKTHPVGGKSPNALGIYDMSGNVWEWVEDVYNSNAYSQPNRRNNPVVTGGGSNRVFRGGSWRDGHRLVRSAYRLKFTPGLRRDFLGFRLALSPGQQERRHNGLESQKDLVGTFHAATAGAEVSTQQFPARTEHSSTQASPAPEPPTSRFTDNGDGTVTDTQTGLMWTKDAEPLGYLNWHNAMAGCGTFSISGIGGWRLPSRHELYALYLAIQGEHPFTGVQSSYYWSSTTVENYSGFAWSVTMYSGYVSYRAKTGTYHVWPVRAGQ